MTVKIQEFLRNTYHLITEILETDSILKILTKKGNIVILSEKRYNIMMEMVEENLKSKKN